MSSVVVTPALPPAKPPLVSTSSTSTATSTPASAPITTVPAASAAASFGAALHKANSDASAAGAAHDPRSGSSAQSADGQAHQEHVHGKASAKKSADTAGALASKGQPAGSDDAAEDHLAPLVPSVSNDVADGTANAGGKTDPSITPATPDQGIAAAMLALIGAASNPTPVAPVTSVPVGSSNGDATDGGAGIAAMTSAAPTLTDTLSDAMSDVADVADAAGVATGVTTGMAAIAAPVVDLLGKGAEAALSALTGARPTADSASQALLTANAQNASQLAAAHLAQAGNVAPTPLQSTQVAGTQAFAQELGNQIAWMGNTDIKQASIRLHPEDLGQLDVKVSLQHGRVDVAFAAQHPAAVTAVQQTLSQLDTLLAHHGLSLGQAQVSQQEAGQGGGQSAQHGQGGGTESGASDDTSTLSTMRVSQGLVDDFA
jgi:flagellar hook-length control protein FliK